MASGPQLGSASLLIVPTFDGLTEKMNEAIEKAGLKLSPASEKVGRSAAGGFGKGLAASGAVIGAFSAITSKAMDSIASHVGSAVSRFDTLNNYPKVMQSLGYGASEAQASISLMSDRLSTLPTRLDDMASIVQGIVVSTHDLDKATKAGLALNDMLVASGSSTQLSTAAMEQFRQILAKGKPEMQDWRSLTSAMPGQMDQLAKSMLGASATASDLYYALGGGKEKDEHMEGLKWASVSCDQLLDAMIRLDTEGSGSIASFQSQAETAAGGVQTSLDNLSNAVTKGITGTLDAVGKENIASMLGDAKAGVNQLFGAVNSGVSSAMPAAKQMYGLLKESSAGIAGFAAGFSAVSVAGNAVGGAVGRLKEYKRAVDANKESASALGVANAALGTSFTPVGIAVAAASVGVGLLVGSYAQWEQNTKAAEKATSGLLGACARTESISGYKGAVEGVGKATGTTAKSVSELMEYMGKSVDAMNENAAKAEAQVSALNAAQSIIDQYAGETDLSTEAQGKLSWAISQVNEQLGLNVTASDVAANSYQDQNGEVVNLKDSIDQLIQKKKEEAQAEAVTANLTEAYKARSEAAKTLAEQEQKHAEKMEEAARLYPQMTDSERNAYANMQDTTGELKKARDAFSAADETCRSYETQLGNVSQAAEGVGNTLGKLSSGQLDLVNGAIAMSGQSVSELGDRLDFLGVDVDAFSSLGSDDISRLASDFDGHASSIVGDLEDMGIGMDGAAAATAKGCKQVSDSLSSVDGMGDVFSSLNLNMGDFASKCVDAGLSSEDFAGVSADSFRQLYDECGGDLDAMVAVIATYNSVPLVDKDGNVRVDDATLTDASGHLYAYNDQGLYDKTAGAYVDSAQVTDATGTVWEWDGTSLVSKDADATVTGNAVTGDAQGKAENTQAAIQRLSDKAVSVRADGNAADGSAASNIWNTVSAIGRLASRTVDVVTNTVNNVINTVTNRQNARGGFRPHADGGIRPHASGAIATRAVPLDIVGEDGAEAIVPLTNKRYSEPFARTLAEQMGEAGGQDKVVAWLAANLGPIIRKYAPTATLTDRDVARLVRKALA